MERKLNLCVFIGIKNKRWHHWALDLYKKGSLKAGESTLNDMVRKEILFLLHTSVWQRMSLIYKLDWIGVVKKWLLLQEMLVMLLRDEKRCAYHRRGFCWKLSLAEKWHIFPERGKPDADNRAMLRTFLKWYIF